MYINAKQMILFWLLHIWLSFAIGDELPDEIYVISDIHGDAASFKKILRFADIVNNKLEWTDTDKTRSIIQLGDIADRGETTILTYGVMHSLLQSKPEKHDLTILLGNHELMLLCKEYRYFNPRELAILFKNSIPSLTATVSQDGEIGQFIRNTFKLRYSIGDVLFTHAGLELPYANSSDEMLLKEFWHNVDDLNCDRGGPYSATGSQGILWTRGISGPLRENGDSKPICDYVEEVKKLSGMNKIIVGHTPTGGMILSYCDNSWILHDTGISSSMAGDVSYSVMIKSFDEAGNVLPVSQWHHKAYNLSTGKSYMLYPKEFVYKLNEEL